MTAKIVTQKQPRVLNRNLVGQKFGKLTVLSKAPRRPPPSKTFWECKCDCGTEKEVTQHQLLIGKTKSCGCLRRLPYALKHGLTKTPTHVSWTAMKTRCTNPKQRQYKDYGGRGITVCARWMESFENFYADMGDKPQGTSLDRIDNEKGYFKENCRWATRKEQRRNCRGIKLINYGGKSWFMTDLAKQFGIRPGVLLWRLKQRWPLERALSTQDHRYIGEQKVTPSLAA